MHCFGLTVVPGLEALPVVLDLEQNTSMVPFFFTLSGVSCIICVILEYQNPVGPPFFFGSVHRFLIRKGGNFLPPRINCKLKYIEMSSNLTTTLDSVICPQTKSCDSKPIF